MKIDSTVKQLLERLSTKVNNEMKTPLVSFRNCTATKTTLNFYKNFNLYTLIDYSFTPIAKYHLLDNENTTLLLDGTFSQWSIANQIEPPELISSNIVDYVKIVLGTISSSNENIRIITNIDDIDFYKMPNDEQFQLIDSNIKPPVISIKKDFFTILISILKGNSLYDGLIQIQTNGDIDLIDKNLIIDGIPVDELVWDQ